jgi:hypothetical protein
VDRRSSLQWMLAACAVLALPAAEAAPRAKRKTSAGYGSDPDVMKRYRSGTLWPLAMSAAERRCARALCDTVIPADGRSPGAAELHVEVFIDEWISAPYPAHAKDREVVRKGLAWIDDEARRRFQAAFADLTASGRQAICDTICHARNAAPELTEAAAFFARFRDLTAGGFYTTPAGAEDLRFVGNRPSASFDGPPPEVLKIVGVS